MNKDNLSITLKEYPFFKDREIVLHSIYLNDPLEKCFMAEDVNSGEIFKIRCAVNEFPKTVVGEFNAFQYLISQGVRWMPRIYFADLKDHQGILVYEYISGESLDKLKHQLTPPDHNLIREKLVSIISELHSFSTNYFGDFTGNTSATWTAFFRLKLFAHVKSAYDIGLLSKNECKLIEAAFNDTMSYYDTVSSHFLHFDIKPTNIIFNPISKEVHLIDFELSRFGDTRIEYSRFITSYEKLTDLYSSLFVPLAKELLGSDYQKFIKTRVFYLYNLYNLLAYYATSYIKHGITREYLAIPIKETIKKLS